jgi:glucosamine--fructose-6-phosphate aminotransferase (isomerizing)
MGAIVGYIGMQEAAPIVLAGLQKLEDRNYDSAGLCTVELHHAHAHIRRCKGKLVNLARLLSAVPARGTVAIGHIRLATHGTSSEINAHPHKAGPVVLVHNGIIENYLNLKNDLLGDDHTFKSDTDSEVIAHLIEQKMYQGSSFEEAVRASLLELKGTFALCLVSETEPGMMIAAAHGSPLLVGMGEGEYFISSDAESILPHTRKIVSIEDDEMAVFKDGSVLFSTISGEAVVKILGHVENYG